MSQIEEFQGMKHERSFLRPENGSYFHTIFRKNLLQVLSDSEANEVDFWKALARYKGLQTWYYSTRIECTGTSAQV